MQQDERPRRRLESLRAQLSRVPPVEAHLVLQLSVRMMLGQLEPSNRALRDKCAELITPEQQRELTAALGSSGWGALYESLLSQHRSRARSLLVSTSIQEALKPAGYLPTDWFSGGRLPRMLNATVATVETVRQAGPDAGAAVLSRLLRDDQERPFNMATGVYCPACQSKPSRSGRTRQVRVASLQLRGSGPVLVHQPSAPPTPDALRIKREHHVPPPVVLLPPQLRRLNDSSWATVELRCQRGHAVVMDRLALLDRATRQLPDTLPDRYLGT